MPDLEGEVAIVTGAAGQRGQGHAEALRLAREGADIVVVDLEEPIVPVPEAERDPQWKGLSSVVEEIEQLGRRALAVTADVSDWAQVQRMAEETLDRFGRIDILVNNAGALQAPAPIIDMEESVWDYVMSVNAKGVFLCCKRIAREMIAQRSGSIINISSRLGLTGKENLGAYCASKFAVVAITQVLAREVMRYGVRVNAVCQGWVDTDMNWGFGTKEAQEWGVPLEEAKKRLIAGIMPINRMAGPDEIASVVAFLASDQSSYMTGESISVSGGFSGVSWSPLL